MMSEEFALKMNVLAFASRYLRNELLQSQNWSHEIASFFFFVYRLPSVNTTEYSSPSWSSTTRRWSD